MIKSHDFITQLHSIRNLFGKQYAVEKIRLMESISHQAVSSKKDLLHYFDTLQFIIAYPDNRSVYEAANQSLQQLQSYIQGNEKVKTSLYNSGVTGSTVCTAFSFYVTKWLKQTRRDDVTLSYFDADDARIQAVLSVVMSKVESEILQDANAEWRGWLNQQRKKGEDLLDQLIAIFDSSSLRPDVKEELWNAIGINIEINFSNHCRLPDNLITPHFHRSIIRKVASQKLTDVKLEQVKLSESDAEQIIDCSRLILVRHLREIDPISYTAPKLVSYYILERGLSIALVGMVAERRHPNDSYMGYTVYKNGLPIAYAASWVLFDSARISLNVFPGYRGGESQYIFQQVLRVHKRVYRLKRFSVDPYQIGKENSDGIKSGAFWIWYHVGFRPMLKEQRKLADTEALKIRTTKGYRSPPDVLKKLADSRMELGMQNNAVTFDTIDLSLAWANIIKTMYNNDRILAEKNGVEKLASILRIKDYGEMKMNFILQNWCVLLLSNEKELRSNNALKQELKKFFELKANGREEDYISEMQRAKELRKFLEVVIKEHGAPSSR